MIATTDHALPAAPETSLAEHRAGGSLAGLAARHTDWTCAETPVRLTTP